jgi:hypothetical protein
MACRSCSRHRPPACLAGLPLYMLLPAVQRLEITGDCPLEQRLRSRVERTGDGARFKRAYTRPATNAAAWSVSPGTYS